MANLTSPQNTNNRDTDSVVLSDATGLHKRGVAGSSRAVSGLTGNAVTQEVGTDVDSATFAGVGTAIVSAQGLVVDDTSTVTVSEGKVGIPRMGTDRVTLTREMGPVGSRASHAIAIGTAATSIGTAITTGRIDLTIYNAGTVTVYLGPSSVGTASGMPLGTAMYYSESSALAIYGITASGTASLRVMERS